jgi:hypothetical protein
MNTAHGINTAHQSKQSSHTLASQLNPHQVLSPRLVLLVRFRVVFGGPKKLTLPRDTKVIGTFLTEPIVQVTHKTQGSS